MKPLWAHAFGESAGILAIFSGERAEPGSKQLDDPRTLYFDYPREAGRAEALCRRLSDEGREVYQCAHLLTARRRVKTNAAPLTACYVDGDGAKPTANMPRPTAIVVSSPGREQYWWRLSRPVEPEEGEDLNRRLAYAMSADLSGWDLTQLLRVPGTRNHKYPDAPLVELAYLSEDSYDPAELAAALPEAHGPRAACATRSVRPAGLAGDADLSRLSERTRELVLFGDREGRYAKPLGGGLRSVPRDVRGRPGGGGGVGSHDGPRARNLGEVLREGPRRREIPFTHHRQGRREGSEFEGPGRQIEGPAGTKAGSVSATNVKPYEAEGFYFEFSPNGSPFVGTLRATDEAQSGPYEAEVSLHKAGSRERYAKKAADLYGMDGTRLERALNEVCTRRSEEVAAARLRGQRERRRARTRVELLRRRPRHSSTLLVFSTAT